ncbi:MAG: YceI family protein [Acidimicrobiales bacterium]
MQKSVKIALGAVAAVILLGGAGFYWFFLRDDAPARASLQTSSQAADSSSDRSTPDGTWKVEQGKDVFVGYRVQELFGGETIKATAVGRTPGVDGTMTVSGTQVTAVEITADMTALKSDKAPRDGQIKSRGIETNSFPTATFKLTQPITLPGTPQKGQEVDVTATGELTLHGVTKTIDIPLKASWTGDTILVAGGAKVAFSDYAIEPPTNAIVSVDDNGEFELQLTFFPA